MDWAPSQGSWGPQNPATIQKVIPAAPSHPGAVPMQNLAAWETHSQKHWLVRATGTGPGQWGTAHSGAQSTSHKARWDLKPENSLLQRYKSVTAEMYSNKLGGGRGDGAGAGHVPYEQGPPHRVSSQ